MIENFDFFILLDSFIDSILSGRHLLKNGARMRPGTIANYKNLRKLFLKFCYIKKLNPEIGNLIKCTQNEYLKEKKKWMRIYKQFIRYLYTECNHYDNYVGSLMKLLRSFFYYLRTEKGIDSKGIPRIFYVIKEEIPIVVLSTEQLNFLVSDIVFEKSLSHSLIVTKDMFTFGCTVGLRISDLLALKKSNLERIYADYYLKFSSKKTGTHIRIKLPGYANKIIEKYTGRFSTLFPKISIFTFNKNCKKIAEKAGWTQVIDKKRSKRGVTKIIKRFNSQNKYRFCDLITSHTMRRTAITLYLSLGMPEQLVRRISGHSPNSKEFFRYVKISEEILDKEISKVHSKLENLQK